MIGVASAESAHPCSINPASRSNFIFTVFTVDSGRLAAKHLDYPGESSARLIQRRDQSAQIVGAPHPERNRQLIRAKFLGQVHRYSSTHLNRRNPTTHLLLPSPDPP